MQQPAVIWGVLIALVVGAIGVSFWLFSRQSGPSSSGLDEGLPTSVIGWHRAPDGKRYDPETIFSYIDGHAEVYLAYGMRSCSAERYTGPEGEPDLILDIFEMASPADAFGVFTHDTEGEAVGIGRDSRFRYGWLSFWQGHHFVSIVAEGETDLSKRAALELGRQVAGLLPGEGSAPPIVGALPVTRLEMKSVRYLHHPQILSTHLPVDPNNLLELGQDTPAALGTYREGEDRAYLLVVDYPEAERAARVEAAIRDRLLAELAEQAAPASPDRYSGCMRNQTRLALVVEAPTEEWMTELLQSAVGPESEP